MESEGSQYAVGWITLAMIVAGFAQTKERSSLIWFIIALILGPIALLILLFLDKPEVSESTYHTSEYQKRPPIDPRSM